MKDGHSLKCGGISLAQRNFLRRSLSEANKPSDGPPTSVYSASRSSAVVRSSRNRLYSSMLVSGASAVGGVQGARGAAPPKHEQA